MALQVLVDRQDRPNFATMLAQVDARWHGGTPTVPCYFVMPMRGCLYVCLSLLGLSLRY
jgi:hypothetical protein